MLDVIGKTLLALGLGVWLSRYLQPYAGVLVVVGLALSATIKAKYWKRFWASTDD